MYEVLVGDKDALPDLPMFVITGYGGCVEKFAWEEFADLILWKPFPMSKVGIEIKELFS